MPFFSQIHEACAHAAEVFKVIDRHSHIDPLSSTGLLLLNH
jgi:hypothetical protein